MTGARFRHGRGGNVSLLFALLLIPLMGMISFAIDFGAATAARQRLDLAADAAALLATTVASNAYLAGAADPIGPAQLAGAARFSAQANAQAGVSIAALTVVVHQSGTLFTSDVTYSGSLLTTVGQVLGVLNIALNGQSSSALSINPYVDIAVLMDVSSSMTIAATLADITRMQALTAAYAPTGTLPGNVSRGEACAFACHWTATGDDYYALARRSGVTLRLDVLRSAVGNLITTIAGLNTRGAFRLGLSTYAQAFTQIFALNAQITAANAALQKIAPDVNDCSSNCPESYFANAMASQTTLTAASGNGSTQALSQKFLFIVSDGLVDQYTGNNRVIGAVNPADCAAIKAKGVSVLVLYTPYLPLPTNAFYVQNVAPIAATIEPNLQACASSATFYFRADNAAAVDQQLQLMLSAVLQTSGHLTR